MERKRRKEAAITPAEALESLPELEFEPTKVGEEPQLGRIEFLQSVLAIAKMDHVNESAIVRDAVRNALGRVPDVEG